MLNKLQFRCLLCKYTTNSFIKSKTSWMNMLHIAYSDPSKSAYKIPFFVKSIPAITMPLKSNSNIIRMRCMSQWISLFTTQTADIITVNIVLALIITTAEQSKTTYYTMDTVKKLLHYYKLIQIQISDTIYLICYLRLILMHCIFVHPK